jgi:hypothetical protein
MYENDSFIASAEEENDIVDSPINQKSHQRGTVASNASKVNIASVKFVKEPSVSGKRNGSRK